MGSEGLPGTSPATKHRTYCGEYPQIRPQLSSLRTSPPMGVRFHPVTVEYCLGWLPLCHDHMQNGGKVNDALGCGFYFCVDVGWIT